MADRDADSASDGPRDDLAGRSLDPERALDLPLGEVTTFPEAYDPGVLRGIPRALGRRSNGLPAIPQGIHGADLWRAWELSWLDPQGKPRIAVAELEFPASSPQIVESKSLKLYLGSLNNHRLAAPDAVREVLARDLAVIVGAPVGIRFLAPAEVAVGVLAGESLDALEVGSGPGAGSLSGEVTPALLDGAADPAELVERSRITELFRSRCPITGQPDWASVRVTYRGPAIADPALLAYLLSYREHRGFHETCVERIFADLRARCRPRSLTVQACFTRRGGLDISPWRSTEPGLRVVTPRLWRC